MRFHRHWPTGFDVLLSDISAKEQNTKEWHAWPKQLEFYKISRSYMDASRIIE